MKSQSFSSQNLSSQSFSAQGFSKSLAWTLFAVGLIVAWVGLYDLGVEVVVAGLILSSIAGLYLLHARAEAMGRLDSPRRLA